MLTVNKIQLTTMDVSQGSSLTLTEIGKSFAKG